MLRRLIIYLSEMYPPRQMLASILFSLSFLLCLAKLHSINFPVTLNMLIAIGSSILFSLLLRIMDEFKDFQDDLINHPNRPLPSGLVLTSDLKTLASAVVVLIFTANCFWKEQFFGAVVTFTYCVLMYKWFFCERLIRKDLILAFITHHPVTLFLMGYLALAFTSATGISAFDDASLMMIPIILGITNWEISRKIRGEGEETAYVTYSSIFGAKKAVYISLCIQTISVLGIQYYFYRIETPLLFRLITLCGYLVAVAPYGRFLKTNKNGLQLKAAAEIALLASQVALIISYFL
jgi:4-hydroxybenzoate polyprenyltransferase